MFSSTYVIIECHNDYTYSHSMPMYSDFGKLTYLLFYMEQLLPTLAVNRDRGIVSYKVHQIGSISLKF